MLNLIPKFILENNRKDIVYGNFKGITLFQDISGFTKMTEELMKQGKIGAEILSLIINQSFEIIIRIIYQNGGFISTFAGDALTAIFPSGDIERACKVALDSQKYFAENPIKKTRLGEFNLAIKQGLSYGRLDWGIVGGSHYKAFYFKGDAINGCVISESHADGGEIIIDAEILEKLPHGNISLKEKAAYYYLLEEKIFYSINLDEIDTLEMMQDDHYDPDEELLNHDIIKNFFPALDQKDSLKAEFRDLACMFLSFDELETFEKSDMLVTKVLRIAKDFGGYLSSLDFGDKGSLMLFLFGAPIAYEDNSLRVADFASNIKSIFGNKIRIGITSGTVFAGYVGSTDRIFYTALGDVINLAARFMSSAEDGQILISKEVSSDVEREFEVKFIGKREFKGKSEKIEVSELVGKIHFQDEDLHTGDFVGRTEEIQKLDEFCQPFFKNKFSGFIYVYGIVGVGKSRLLFEFTNPLIGDEKGKASIVVLQTDSILKQSLNPFITYFLDFFDILQSLPIEEKRKKFDKKIKEILSNTQLKEKMQSNERVKEIVNQVKSDKSILAALLGIYWKDSLYKELGSYERFNKSLLVIKNFFLIQAYIRPLILVLEDAYYIDESSKKAFDFLVDDIEEVPMVCFASCRLGDDGSKIDILNRNKKVEKKIVLSLLTEEQSKILIESLLGKKVNTNLIQFIMDKTENNPLHIEGFCGYLLERKLIKDINDEYILTTKNADIPESISLIIVSRIDRLSPDLKEVVQTASVLGRKFNIKILAKLIEKDDRSLQAILEEGERQNLWEKGNEVYYHFLLSMIQNVTYSMQLTEDLKVIHKKAGELLEEYYEGNCDYFATIAHHFEIAQIKDKTIKYLLGACKSAHENYRSEEALELYNKLLNFLDENQNEEKLNIYGRMAEINELNGLWGRAYQLLVKGVKFSRKIGAELKGANLKTYMGEILQKKSMLKEASDILNQAISFGNIYSDEVLLGKAYLNLGKVYIDEGNHAKAIACFKRSYSAKKNSQDEIGKGLSLYYIGVVKRAQNDFKLAINYYEKAQDIFRLNHNRRFESYPAYDLGLIYQYQGHLEKAEKTFSDCATLYNEIAYPSGESGALLNLGVIYSMKGENNKAFKTLEGALAISKKINEKVAIAYTLFSIGAIYYRMEDFEKTIEYFKRSLVLMNEIGVSKYYGYIFSYLSCTYAKQGKTSLAIKSAYCHIKNVETLKTDVENGLTYLGVAVALTKSDKLSALTKKRLEKIAEFSKIIENKELPETYFLLSINIAQKMDYVSTLIPALFLYAEYLFRQNNKAQAKKYIEEARSRAEQSSFNIFLEKIEAIEKAKGM